MTTAEVLADLEDERATVAEQAQVIDSLSTLWLTLRTAARQVVDQVPDREGDGCKLVRKADLRMLDAASAEDL